MHILLIQEPYIFGDQTFRITCIYSTYKSFTPVDDWSSQPRVLTYTNKNTGHSVVHILSEPLPVQVANYIIFLKVKAPDNNFITIIYTCRQNAPPKSVNSSSAPNFIFFYIRSFYYKNYILVGDFNLQHINWQSSNLGTPSAQTAPLIQWLKIKNFFLILEDDIPKYNRGNFLDLCFAS